MNNRASMSSAVVVVGLVMGLTTISPVHAADSPTSPVTKLLDIPNPGLGIMVSTKTGYFMPVSNKETIGSASRKLSSSSLLYGVHSEWRDISGFAVGFEWFSHNRDYKTVGSAESGDADFSYYMTTARYFFKTQTVFEPFVGAGIGRTTADFSAGGNGGISSSVDSNAFQVVTGINYRWKIAAVYVSAYAEYKYLHDLFTLGGTVNASGHALSVSFGAHF